MTKTIIQVWGTAERGKSATIKILKEELIQRYQNPSHTYSFPLPQGDISEVIICNGVKVALESMGDYLMVHNLKGRLTHYVTTQNCDIIICASRVYNDVSKYIAHLADTHNYRLLKVTNYRGPEPPFSNDNLNQLSARHILDIVDQIITNRI